MSVVVLFWVADPPPPHVGKLKSDPVLCNSQSGSRLGGK